MTPLNIILMSLVVILGVSLVLVLDNSKVQFDEGLLIDENLQTEKLIQTFKEKYQGYEITEFPDSKGVPYKYSATLRNGQADLIFEKDRIFLKVWINEQPSCMVSDPLPRDILDNCPMKW